MNFWRKGGSQSQHVTSSSKHSGIVRSSSSTSARTNNSLNNNDNATSNRPPSIIRPSSNVSSSTMPSRMQRMHLLKCIIHHADKVQNEYLVPKNNAVDPTNNTPKQIINSILVRRDTDVAEINEKCFQRWHQVLQEGLVPMSVHALNLLQKSTNNVRGDEEEEAYFASLREMEEEIQVMAILARAATFIDDAVDASVDSEHGMDRLNAVMKCIAMLLFHIVLDASSSGSCETTKENTADLSKNSEARTSVAGYDGRIRHVVKLASVDVLSRAIIESVNNSSREGFHSSGTIYNIDDCSSWDVTSLTAFLDQTDLGRDAIFGTLFKPSAASVLESGNTSDESKENRNQKQEDTESIFVNSTDSSLPTDIVSAEDQAELEGQIHRNDCGGGNSDNLIDDADQAVSGRGSSSIGKGHGKQEDAEVWNNQIDKEEDDERNTQEPGTSDAMHSGEDVDLHARRLFNANFLATRKFELIERLVAIEIVRFFMAEERELKMRQKDRKKSLSSDDETYQDECSEQGQITNSQFFSAKQIKRGAKIAGAGLALGTVFAITGGLAAPALAAALGGITALTGATTATSTALLALLATFKAGAALFGVGGGGLAAYKMNKRTAGLSDFEIRRENIEQYMYLGAPEEKMKKGIESMLPQLHTTVAVSGWLRDKDVADFQLAWGVQPTCKYDKSTDEHTIRIRKMKRFYSIYNPPLVHACESFMQILQSKLKRKFSWDRQVTPFILFHDDVLHSILNPL